MTLAVSVVIPTCQRPDLLDRCLAALTAQEFDPAAYEIIVVDDGASCVTRRQVEDWRARTGRDTRYLPATHTRGPAAARNLGWRNARAPVIAFTDDDCIPAPDWLREGLKALVGCGTMTTELAGVWGRIVVPLPAIPTDYELNAAGLATAEAATANCFYRRDALAAAGGFDERFTAAWREDSDLFFTLLDHGARIAYAPGAVITHPVRPASWGVSLRQQRKNFYNALLYKKHPALYRQRIQAAPPWHYYGSTGALMAALISARSRHRGVCGAAFLSWFAFTARFCARRLQQTSRAPRHVAEMIVTSALIPPLAVFWRLRGALKFRMPFL